jgi:hypothetical protein
MPKQHVFDFGWLIVEEDDGSVFAIEDIRDLKDAGAASARHGPFATVEEAKVWIANEQAAVDELEGRRRPQ